MKISNYLTVYIVQSKELKVEQGRRLLQRCELNYLNFTSYFEKLHYLAGWHSIVGCNDFIWPLVV